MASHSVVTLLKGQLLLTLFSATCAAYPTVLLSNGVHMPMVAAGTFMYNSSQAQASVQAALSVGFPMVDTASDYNNQVGVGLALQGVPRGAFFLMTKIPGCGQPGVRLGHCEEDTTAVLEANLGQLNQSYVDAVLIHSPPLPAIVSRSCKPVCGMIQAQWRAMSAFYKAGKARVIGVSNYCDTCVACLEAAPVQPMINQIMYNFGMGKHWRGFDTTAHKINMTLQAYSPLGSDLFKKFIHQNLFKDVDIIRISKAHNRSVYNVALKFITDQGVPVVTKSSNPTHLRDDLDLWAYSLSANDTETLARKIAPKVESMTTFMCTQFDKYCTRRTK